MNKFFASVLIAAAVGLSAVATQAMPLGSNQTQDSLVVPSLADAALASIADPTADAVPTAITAVATGAPRPSLCPER